MPTSLNSPHGPLIFLQCIEVRYRTSLNIMTGKPKENTNISLNVDSV